MQIKVAELLKLGTGASSSYKIDDTFCFADEGINELQLWGKVDLIRTGRGILVRGRFQGKTPLMCSRCLSLFDYSLTFKIEEEFLALDATHHISEYDDISSFIIDEHHILDLSEAMRQYTLLSIPMKPLCSSNCAGLCPQCGSNLNQGVCHCITKELPKSVAGF